MLKIKPAAGSSITFNFDDLGRLEVHIGEKEDWYYSWLDKKQINQLKTFLNDTPTHNKGTNSTRSKKPTQGRR